jgi:hypothetical protein
LTRATRELRKRLDALYCGHRRFQARDSIPEAEKPFQGR